MDSDDINPLNMPAVERLARAVDRYRQRLEPATNLGELFERIEDFPDTIEPKVERPWPEPIPSVVPSKSFRVASSPSMISEAVSAFTSKFRDMLDKPFAEQPSLKESWISAFLVRLRAVHHQALGMPRFCGPAIDQSTGSIAGWNGLMEMFGFSAMFTYQQYTVLPMRTPRVKPKRGKKRWHGPYGPMTGLVYVPGTIPFDPVLQPEESPYLLCTLYVNHLGCEEEIQTIAAQGLDIDVVNGSAVWPPLAEVDEPRKSKIEEARQILAWVFESACQSNAEYIKLGDGWHNIYFYIEGNSTVNVGPTLTPRYPRNTACANPAVSLAQAYFAILWQAHSRKVFNADRTRCYVPGWVEPNVSTSNTATPEPMLRPEGAVRRSRRVLAAKHVANGVNGAQVTVLSETADRSPKDTQTATPAVAVASAASKKRQSTANHYERPRTRQRKQISSQ